MIQVFQIVDPLNPNAEAPRTEHEDGCSVRQILNRLQLSETQTPFIVTVKGEPVMQKDWERTLPAGSTVAIIPIIAGFEIFLILAIAIAIVAIAIALTTRVPNPRLPSDGPQADTVYTLRGQQNQIRLNEPIEAAYGRVRLWPSYASRPYNRYIGNQSYQYSLFCLGHGHFQFNPATDMRIEDTPLSAFQDVQYEVIEPFGPVTLFRDAVQTSSEVSSVELYAPNQDEYSSWFTAVVNDANTTIDRIELDLILPRGLYWQTPQGDLVNALVEAEFQFIEINNAGTEIGAWQPLFTFSRLLATVDPKRFTNAVPVPLGRYKVRGRRTNDSGLSFRNSDTLVWESVRGYFPNVNQYGNVTLVATRIRATANLNDQSARRFNIVATRKIRTWDAVGGWSEPVATRSIVWAFCDVVRSLYGGNLDEIFLDLESLKALDNALGTDGRYFDWVFDTRTTVWEALRAVARAGRALPLLANAQLYMERDEPQPVIQHIFNKENIVKDTLQVDLKLFKREEWDSIEAEYVEPQTWAAETVICVLENSLGERPERVVMAGITDRDWAWRDGMQILKQRRLSRMQITFRTGLEGFLATYGERAKIILDAFSVNGSVGGYVEGVVGQLITLSENVEFEEDVTHAIILREADGTPAGPYTVIETSDPNVVQVIGDSITSDLNTNPNAQPPYFIFGPANALAKDVIITGLSPRDDETVEVTAIEYNPEVYENDTESAPPFESPIAQPQDPSIPVVTGLSLTRTGTAGTYEASWNVAPGASYYVLQMSSDPTQWDNNPNEAWDTVAVTQSTLVSFLIQIDYVYLRAAAVNVAQGPWATFEGPRPDAAQFDLSFSDAFRV